MKSSECVFKVLAKQSQSFAKGGPQMKHLIFHYLKKIRWALIIAPLLFMPLYTLATESAKRVDLDGDGFAETQLIYEGKTLVKAIIDENGDGKIDGMVYYKNGMRERAERDINFDGRMDTWIKYDYKGIPWLITRDKNGDGQIDYWKYMKNGFVYKRAWDRNRDGKQDLILMIPGKSDFRQRDEHYQLLEKFYDDNYDGTYEKVVRVKKRVPHVKVSQQAGAIGEF